MILFLLYFAIVQSKKALADPKPTPETYPLAVSTRQMTKSNNYQCEPDDPECPFDDLSNPDVINCGQRCWSSDGSAVFEYTFKGVQFVLYGKKASNHGSFDLIIDDKEPEVIDERSSTTDVYALLYTSDVLDYKEHKIVMKGKGNAFELFRLSYWPSLHVRRLNSSDFTSTGSWVYESDENGGTRHYTNNPGARKSISLEGSKVWVYATEDPYHGIMNVKFHTLDANIDTHGTVRKDGILLHESEELPFGLYNLDISCVTPAILIYCVYYEYNPPPQTQAPFPSRTYYPETDQTYINKKFTGLTIPNEQIIVTVNSKINQISGCTFTDISENKYYFIRLDKEIPFFDNRVEFTSIQNKKIPAPIWLNYVGKFSVVGCTFIKCRADNNKGNVLTSDFATEVDFEACTFLNCGNKDDQAITKFYDASSSIKYVGCTFYFDIETLSCPAISGKSSNIIIDRCSFTKCAAVNIESQTIPAKAKSFQFTNNVVTSSNQRVINVNNYLHTKPIISGNTFDKHNLYNSYFIVLRHDISEDIEFFNNTFSSMTTNGTNNIYGGSIGLWVETKNFVKNSLVFDSCKFIGNKNNWVKEPHFFGGAFQYGYSKSIANTSMKFVACEFKDNVCTNGKGGAIAISINYDLYIADCIFQNNNAGKAGGAIYIFGKIVDSTTSKPIGEALRMESITITNCQFKLNKGKEGNAIYIEEENIDKVKLDITKCTFSDNGNSLSTSMIVSFCGEVLFEDNVVQYSDKTKACAALKLTVSRNLLLSNSNFTNCATSSKSSIILTQKDTTTTTIKKCSFINCKASDFTIIIPSGSAEVDDCTVSFDSNNANTACGAIKFNSKGLICKYSKFIKAYSKGALMYDQPNGKTDPILVTNCIFDECGGENTRCFNLKSRTEDFTFSNNIVQNMKAGINVGYFGQIASYINKMKNFVFQNVTFKDNLCKSEYGGGTGLWVINTEVITFDNCKFINNVALKSTSERSRSPANMKYFAGDGGAIQYGHSTSIYSVDMVFKKCTFTQNKAVRHGGALAIQTCQKVEISECTFDGNVANYKPSSKLLFQDYYNLKEEGRGGAIYFNPVFTYIKQPNQQEHDPTNNFLREAKIDSCTFTSNSAFDGYAIYIEGDDPGTKFIITNNRFKGNYDTVSNSMERGIITSEIDNIYEGKVVSSNKFEDRNIAPLLFVYHDGNTPTPTPPPTPLPTPIETVYDDEKCGTRCYFVGQDENAIAGQLIKVEKKSFDENSSNKTESGGAIYFINCGLSIKDSKFNKCKSTGGGGGAIYINNDFDQRNQVLIEDVTFTGCQSYYGGAVYIRSSSYNSEVSIKRCIFTSNQLLDKKDGIQLYGGSALYLHARSGNVENCQFESNKGKGGAVKVINIFDDNGNGISLMQGSSIINNIFIKNCLFNDQDKSTSSIYYIGGKFGSYFEVTNCEFKGALNEKTHYIDGKQITKDSPKLFIKSCKFDGDYKYSLNIKEDFFLVDLNDQKFKADSAENKSGLDLVKLFYLAGVPTLAVLAIVVIFVAVKITKHSQQENEDGSDDDNSQNL